MKSALFLYTSAAFILLIVFILVFAKASKRFPAVTVSLIAVMTALSAVSRIVFAPLSGFKPCTAVIIITGVTLGAPAGFICGALTALISNLYFGQGYWTFFQMLAWGIIGMLSGLFSAALRRRRAVLYIFAAFSGVLFSFIMDIYTVLFTSDEFTAARLAAVMLSSVPFSAVYVVSNIIFLAVLYKRLSFSIGRVMNKYGYTDEE